jgi:hypothetical protein
MKRWIFYLSVALSFVLADARHLLQRMMSGLSSILRKLFLPGEADRLRSGKRSHFTRKRLLYLARVARVELSAARDLGASAQEFLSEGRTLVARRAARGAYFHWRNARKAFERFSAVR